MGGMYSDPLGYIIKQYGQDVCKYIVSIKSSEFIDQTAPKLIEKVQKQFQTTAGSLDKEFDSKQTAIKTNFTTAINQLKQSHAETLEAFKTSRNKTEEQLFGLDSIQDNFNKLKSLKDSKLKEQEQNILKSLNDKTASMKKSIEDSKPSLPLFDSMPICLRQKVLSEGEAKFAPQIKEKQDELMKVIDNVTNLGNLQASIKKAVGLDEADSMVKSSSSAFENAKKFITNGPNFKMGKTCFG